MAIDVKSLLCPQCGAAEVEMISDTQGVCNYCGAKFTVQPRIENVTKEIHIHPTKISGKKESNKSEILPSFTQKDFLRNAWIALAKEGAPLDIFSEDFSEVTTINHEIVIDKIDAEVSFSASVGYDREEPYIDYETYYEDEPYLTTESYYDREAQKTRTRQVTKYKRVAKKRQVTKYKTVTDWSPISNKCRIDNYTAVENSENVQLDSSRFFDAFDQANVLTEIVPVTAEKAAQMQVSDYAKEQALSEHMDHFDFHLRHCGVVPGDHIKNLRFSIVKKYKSSADLYEVPEYESQISFRGKTYKKKAFPFGEELAVYGSSVSEEDGLAQFVEQKKQVSSGKTLKASKAIEQKEKACVFTSAFLSIGLLLASIVLSILVQYYTPLLIGFGVAAAFFVSSLIFEKHFSEKADAEMDRISKNEKDILQKEIDSFTAEYRRKQRKALDSKFSALGLAPLSEDEF